MTPTSTGTAPESDSGTGSGPAVGTWGHEAPGQPRLELVDDGTFTGTDGCNRLFGSWSHDEGAVAFSGVASTRMACIDVDTWLERMHSARVDGNRLHFRDSDGAEIGTLERAAA